MPVDVSSYGVAPIASPVDAFSRAFGQGQESQLRQQAIQQNTRQEQEAQRKIAEDDAYKQAIASSTGMTDTDFLEHVRTSAPGSFLSVQKAVDEAKAKAATTAASVAQARESAAQASNHMQAYLGHVADQIDQSDYNPIVVNAALNLTQQQFPELKPQVDQMRQIAAVKGKEALKAALKPLIDAGTMKTRTDTAAAAAEIPGKQAASAIQQQVAAGTVGGMTPEQQAANKVAQQNAATARGQLGVAQTRETREAAAAKAAAGDVTSLTPEGLDAAATMFAKTGQLPALGMGDKQTRKQIINRAAAMMPGLDIASAKADYGANTDSLKNVTKTLDTLTAFENTAGKNLDQFLALAAKVPDTGIPWLNAPIRSLNLAGLGSGEQAAANAARVVALREIARVTNDPKLSGVLSDSARKEVSDLSPESATFAQIRTVAQTLKNDMANVHSSLDDQKSAIVGRLRKANDPTTPAAAPAADRIRVKGPNGETGTMPAGSALPPGWSKAGG